MYSFLQIKIGGIDALSALLDTEIGFKQFIGLPAAVEHMVRVALYVRIYTYIVHKCVCIYVYI